MSMRGFVVALCGVALITGCTPERATGLASPTPIESGSTTADPATPSPTATATPDPTPIATAPPRPTPRPTSTHAGVQLLPYYFQARQLYPVLPPVPQIDYDDPDSADGGDAWYRGLNAAGQPIFAVRSDYVMTPNTAFHEVGHAYQGVLEHKLSPLEVRNRYWTFRGFPGTWDTAVQYSYQQSGMTQWLYSPTESFAEAFKVGMLGGGGEKTWDYGRTINPVTARAFFQSLSPAP
jgi:hypothetical protein